MDEFRSRARGLHAWDEHGGLYRRKNPDATVGDAARVIKRGGRVGLLFDWGDPEIEWVELPPVASLQEAKARLASIEATFADQARDDAALSRSIWKAADGGALLLLEAEF